MDKISSNYREDDWKKKLVASQASHEAFLEAAAKREEFLEQLSEALKAVGIDLRGLLQAHTKALLSSTSANE